MGLLAPRAWIVAVLLSGLSGCQESSTSLDTQRAARRAEFQLAQEPGGALGILDAREAHPAGGELVLVGKIGGVDNPWVQGRSSFIISDPSAAAADEHDQACDCKFCKQKHSAADAIAVVQLVDAAGQAADIDAQQLFDLAAGQTVVVRGRAKLDRLGCMTVLATGLYVRR